MKLDPSVYSKIVNDSRVPNGAFRLWHLLKDYGNPKGIAWPSVRTIQKKIGCSYPAFRKWLAILIDCSYVEVRKGNRQRSNEYSFKTLLQTPRQRYDEYLNSPEWKVLRAQVIVRDGGACVMCGSTKILQVHHRAYQQNLRDVPMEDLVTLCKKCHEKQHNENAQTPNNYATESL